MFIAKTNISDEKNLMQRENIKEGIL